MIVISSANLTDLNLSDTFACRNSYIYSFLKTISDEYEMSWVKPISRRGKNTKLWISRSAQVFVIKDGINSLQRSACVQRGSNPISHALAGSEGGDAVEGAFESKIRLSKKFQSLLSWKGGFSRCTLGLGLYIHDKSLQQRYCKIFQVRGPPPL